MPTAEIAIRRLLANAFGWTLILFAAARITVTAAIAIIHNNGTSAPKFRCHFCGARGVPLAAVDHTDHSLRPSAANARPARLPRHIDQKFGRVEAK
jgi:hypothetical protein